MTILSRLFAGSRTSSRRAARDRRNASRGSVSLSSILEQLEQRRVLTATYLGVYHTNFANTTEEKFEYVVDVQKSGPADTGDLYVRYNAQYNRIDFDTNSGFTNINNSVFIAPVGKIGGPQSAPFSVPALVTVIGATWNGPTLKENFHSAGIVITGDAGTTVHLVNGDPLPLGLDISLTTSVPGPGVTTSSILLDGPIDTTTNVWSNGLFMQANQIIASSAIKDNHIDAGFDARDLVEFRNTITTGQVTSNISDGDFHLLAGAVINADLGVFMGQTGFGVGFGGVGGDILIDGTVNAGSVTLQTNSPSQATNIVTGPSGMLSGGGSLTLFNAGIDGGRIDIATKNFAVTNVNVGAPNSVNPDIGISIDQQSGNLRIAAVPSSSGQISLKASAANAQIIVNSDIKTQGGLSLDASILSITSPLTTQAGNIRLSGDTVTMGSNVTAGANGVGNVSIKSRKGAVSVLSAAVVSAPGGSIDITSATDVLSQATLASDSITVSAGGSVTLKSNANTIEATAGTGISITDADDLLVLSATTASGPISISAGGILTVDAVTDKGQGAATLSGSAGVVLGSLRLQNGSGTVSSDRGSVRVTGTVAVQGTDNDLSLASTTGNVIVESTANVSVADQLAISAPSGRVLTPGSVTAVRVDSSGAGYASAPTVTLDAGSGATATPTVFSGGVSGIRVTSGGTGYVTAPTVNIIGGGINAKATAFISGGSVTRIVVSNPGSGYSSTTPPVITFSGGSGSGATAQAMVGGISSISVTNGGSGYIVPPEVVISAGAGAQAGAVSVDTTGKITSINLSTPGSDYGVAPTVQINDASGAGFGATAKATMTAGVTNYLLTAPGSGYSTAPTVSFTNAVGDTTGTGASAKALISGSVAAINFDKVTQGGSGYPADPQVSIVGDGQGATATAKINGSVLTSTVVDGGTYATVPTVSLSAPDLAGGIQAAATATLGLTSASVTLSYAPPQVTGQTPTLYSTAPTITFRAPVGGTAAQGTVLLDDTGLVTGVRIDNPGSGYTTFGDADITLSGGTKKFIGTPLTAPTGNANNFTVSGLTITNQGGGYSFNPAVTFSTGTAFARAFVFGSIDSVTLTSPGGGYTSTPNVVFSGGTGASATTTLSAQVVGLQILNPGNGYTAAPTVSFSGGGGTGAAATAALSQVVSGITVVSGGTGYNPATTSVTLVPVAGGGGAVSGAISTDSSGKILSVNVATGGDDYLTTPTVTVNDTSGAGRGAVITATVVNNKVTGFVVTDPGSGYNPATTLVTVSSKGSGATAVANLDANGSVASVTVTNSGSGYTAANAVSVRLVPYGRAATGTAAFAPNTVTGVTVVDAGSGYTSAPTVTISGNGIGATASATIVGGKVTGIAVTNPGSGYTGPVTVTISGGGGSGASATALVGGVKDAIVKLPDNAGYANYAALPKVTFSDPGNGNPPATGTAIILNVASINASRLSWTALEAPLEAVTSQFRKLNVNLTGKGDLVLNSTSGSLELQGATTVDGSIVVSAPILSITGNVVVGDASSTRTRQVTLAASGGDLTIDSAVGTLLAGTQVRTPLAQKITLSALQGGIKATAVPGLLTTNDVVFTATNSATIRTSTNTVSGSVSNSTAAISVTQTNTETNGTLLPLDATLLVTTGGNVTLNAGDNKLLIGRIDTGTAGTGIVTLTASEIVEDTTDASSDVVAGTVQLLAQTGNVELDTTASLIGGKASQGKITINNVSGDGVLPVPAIKLQNLSARNDITVSSASTITAIGLTSVNGSAITLTATGATSDVLVEGLSSPKGIVALSAGRDVKRNDPATNAVSITTGTARVSAAGLVSLRTDVDSLAASAGGNIDVIEVGSIVLGEPTGVPANQSVTSTSGNVTVTAGGSISGFNVQALSGNTTPRTGVINLKTTGGSGSVGLGTIVAGTLNVDTKGDVSDKDPGSGIIDVDSLAVTATGGLVDLANQNNRVGTFSAANAGGDIRLKDTDGGLIVAGITGRAISLTSNGAVTQSMTAAGKIVGTSLDVTTTAGAIDLQNNANDVGQLSATDVGGQISYRDVNDLQVTSLNTGAGVAVLTVGGQLTQTGGITSGSLEIYGGSGAVSLANAANSVGVVGIVVPGQAVTFTDSTGFTISPIGISGGAVSLTGNGSIVQSGASGKLVATSLAVVASSGPIDLQNGSNTVGQFSATAKGDQVSLANAGDLVIAGLQAKTADFHLGGKLSQSAAIAIESLSIYGAGGAISLNRNDNHVGTLGILNADGDVSYRDSGTFVIGDIGLQGGAVSLAGVGTLTQSGSITAKSLSVSTSGGAITLQNDANAIDAFSANAIDGDVSLHDSSDVVIAGINAGSNAVVLQVTGGMTQSAGITAGSLKVDGGTGAIVLADRKNSVASVTSLSTTVGDVTFVNSQTFSTGPVSAGDILDPGVPNDGNIFLKAITGDIAVNGDLTALKDRVTIDAGAGTITFGPGVAILADVLVYYYSPTAPAPELPAIRPSIVAANGNLDIVDPLPDNSVLQSGYETTGNITIRSAVGFDIAGLLRTTGAGSTVTLTADTGSIRFLGGAGAVSSGVGGIVRIEASLGSVTGSADTLISADTTSVVVSDSFMTSGRVNATTLDVQGGGREVTLSGTNGLGSISVANGGSVTINNNRSLVLADIDGGSVAVTAAGAVTQTGSIAATSLQVDAGGNAIVLAGSTNSVGSFGSANGAGSVTLANTSGSLVLTGVTGGTVKISTHGAVSQTAPITAAALSIEGVGDSIALTDANQVGTLAVANAQGSVSFASMAGALQIAGLTGGSVTINASGAVSQTAVIKAQSLSIAGNGKAIMLTQANEVGSFAADNANGSVSLNDTTGGLTLDNIMGGTVTLNAVGPINQTGRIVAGVLSITGSGSPIVLSGSNQVGSFAASNRTGDISFTDTTGDLFLGNISSGGLVINTAGNVVIDGTVVNAAGNVSIATQAGSLTVIGPQPNGLLQSSTLVDLTGVQGSIALVNGGLIVAPTIVGNGRNIAVGQSITSTPDLNQAFAAINTLPIIGGSTYEIVIGANLTLSQTLVASRPVSMRSSTGVFTLSAGVGVSNGLVISSTAAGSSLTSLAFSGFSGTGILVNAARNVSIAGVTVTGTRTGTGTGLQINGASNGTTVRGSTFTNNPFGVKLTSATGVTFGGIAPGQRNVISGAARAGVFASGVCTGSSVVKTAFPAVPATRVRYSVSTSKGLRVIP